MWRKNKRENHQLFLCVCVCEYVRGGIMVLLDQKAEYDHVEKEMYLKYCPCLILPTPTNNDTLSWRGGSK